MLTALHSAGFLDVLSSTPAESSLRAPCIHAHLRRLATKSREKSGLALNFADLRCKILKPALATGDVMQIPTPDLSS